MSRRIPVETGLKRRLALAHRQILAYTVDIRGLLERLRGREEELERTRSSLEVYSHQVNGLREVEKQHDAELRAAQDETVDRLVAAACQRDGETQGHLQRIAALVAEVCTLLGLGEERTLRTAQASKLHDLGKLAIPDQILHKPGPLDDAEWVVLRQHTVLGARMLGGSPSTTLRCAETIALSHHERWDGSGYPYGLEGEATPLDARVVMLCDQYDALRSSRPYKRALDHDATRRVLLEGDDRSRPEHFDPRLLDLFATHHHRFEAVWAAAA
jgi:putative two-component system response regulator